MMSSDNINAAIDMTAVCASCGIADIDDVKLKDCDGCDLIRYCSDECQRDHRSQHKKECKKRAAELRDELLFKQPESSYLGDCPICCLPLPLAMKKSTIYDCCSKFICNGCCFANQIREIETRLVPSCPFCRKARSETDEEDNKRKMKRVKANDPVANRREGTTQRSKGEYIKAFDYFAKAAELGDAEAHNSLAAMYYHGHGVEKDGRKEIHHLEEAAIGGHPEARYNLGVIELNRGNTVKAVKHWTIAATQGEDVSMKELMRGFKRGFVEKEVLAAALRAHQAAVNATKSPQREEAEVVFSAADLAEDRWGTSKA